MLRSIVLFLVVVASMLCSPASAQTSADPGTLVQIAAFPSREFDTRPVKIWLPADYDPPGAPYDILYMHAGTKLFPHRGAHCGTAWGVDEKVKQRGGDSGRR